MSEPRTGDVLLFSSNNASGLTLKLLTSSNFNHVGIAIRVQDGKIVDELENTKVKGTLCILELNAVPRYDVISKKVVEGLAITNWDWVTRNYNAVWHRCLKEEVRPKNIAEKTTEFYHRWFGSKFAASVKTFMGVWLGRQMVDEFRKEGESRDFFCSEAAAYYYSFLFAEPDYRKLFGNELPKRGCLYQPKHFSIATSPDSRLLGEEQLFWQQYNYSFSTIIIPLLMLILLWVIFYELLGIGRSFPKRISFSNN